MPDYADVESIGADELDGVHKFTPFSRSVLETAIASLMFREAWTDDDLPIDDMRWNELDELLNRAFEELTTPVRVTQNPIILEDQKSQNTNGGTFTSGAWQQRTLNSKQADDDSEIVLSSNRFTVPAGSWYIEWDAPAHNVQRHQTLLYNVTGAVGLAFGTSEFTNSTSPTQSRSWGAIRLDLAADTQMELQHRCQTTVANIGFGVPANFGTEVFARVRLWKIYK